jgi:hypothetical protein
MTVFERFPGVTGALPGPNRIFLLGVWKKDGFLSAIRGKLPGTYIIYPL